MKNLKSSIAKKLSLAIAPDNPESMYSDIVASLEYPPDAAMGDLALALYRYGLSAEAYGQKNQ